MPVEFIGWIAGQQTSEIIPPTGPVYDPGYIVAVARAHESSGFDRVLTGYYSHSADGFLTALHAMANTERLSVLLAHRPGFVAPSLAARKLATLDQLSGGRAAVHIISGGSDEEQRKDGDFADKAARYRRTDEYLHLLRRVWTEEDPIDHEGEFYRVTGATSDVRCVQQPHIPIYFGGSSTDAVAVSAKHADTYALWGEPLADAAAHIAEVKAAAAAYGRHPGISLSTRPILADSDDEAWNRAHRILDQIRKRNGGDAPPAPSVGSRRLLTAAARGEIQDRCLFTALASATGARGNSTALVGSYDTVARALLDYYDIGVTTFLIRGYEPFRDAVDYGRLIPIVRELVAEREAAGHADRAG